MTIASEIEDLQTNLAAAKAAVTTAGGTVGDTGLAGLATEIGTIPSGGGVVSVPEKDINFYDLDGNVVAAWSVSELATKTALPDNPTPPNGLDNVGWNWTLQELKDGAQPASVGQLYTPTDGKTHIFLDIATEASLTGQLYFSASGTGISIDWGDGSTIESVTDTGNIYMQHTFPAVGRYDVKVNVPEGASANTAYSNVYNSVSAPWRPLQLGSGTANMAGYDYAISVVEIWFGPRFKASTWYSSFKGSGIQRVSLDPEQTGALQGTFQSAIRLKHLTLPRGVTSFGSISLGSCVCLSSLAFSPNMKSFYGESRGLINGSGIRNIFLSPGTTSVGQSLSGNGICSVQRVYIPGTVTSLGANCFNYFPCREYDFSHFTSIPTCGSNAFGSTSNAYGLVIKVPSSLEEDWKAADGWSTYASYIVGV